MCIVSETRLCTRNLAQKPSRDTYDMPGLSTPRFALFTQCQTCIVLILKLAYTRSGRPFGQEVPDSSPRRWHRYGQELLSYHCSSTREHDPSKRGDCSGKLYLRGEFLSFLHIERRQTTS